MPKRKGSLARPAEPLYRQIRTVLDSARAGAYRAVNAAMVQAYWHIGRLIVEHEQGGRQRASYGEALLEDLGAPTHHRVRTRIRRDQSTQDATVLSDVPDSRRTASRFPCLTDKAAGLRDFELDSLPPPDAGRRWGSPRVVSAGSRRSALVHQATGATNLRLLLRTPVGQPQESACPEGSQGETCRRRAGPVHP